MTAHRFRRLGEKSDVDVVCIPISCCVSPVQRQRIFICVGKDSVFKSSMLDGELLEALSSSRTEIHNRIRTPKPVAIILSRRYFFSGGSDEGLECDRWHCRNKEGYVERIRLENYLRVLL